MQLNPPNFFGCFVLKGTIQKTQLIGDIPGLMVIGGDSCLIGREFESQSLMVDFTFICCKIVLNDG